jgi:uncharacterized membrane protein
MPDVGHLWAVAFDDVSRADQVRERVTQLAQRHLLILLDWTVAVRHVDGSFTLDGEPLVHASKGGRVANFLASLALGAPPLTSAAIGVFTNGCDSAGGISEDFVREVERLMKPGTSVLFVVDTVEDMHPALQEIRGLGGTVLKTNVDLERARLIQPALAATTDAGKTTPSPADVTKTTPAQP